MCCEAIGRRGQRRAFRAWVEVARQMNQSALNSARMHAVFASLGELQKRRGYSSWRGLTADRIRALALLHRAGAGFVRGQVRRALNTWRRDTEVSARRARLRELDERLRAASLAPARRVQTTSTSTSPTLPSGLAVEQAQAQKQGQEPVALGHVALGHVAQDPISPLTLSVDTTPAVSRRNTHDLVTPGASRRNTREDLRDEIEDLREEVKADADSGKDSGEDSGEDPTAPAVAATATARAGPEGSIHSIEATPPHSFETREPPLSSLTSPLTGPLTSHGVLEKRLSQQLEGLLRSPSTQGRGTPTDRSPPRGVTRQGRSPYGTPTAATQLLPFQLPRSALEVQVNLSPRTPSKLDVLYAAARKLKTASSPTSPQKVGDANPMVSSVTVPVHFPVRQKPLTPVEKRAKRRQEITSDKPWMSHLRTVSRANSSPV